MNTETVLNKSILTKSQKKVFNKTVGNTRINVKVRYDDQCGNGHNTFAITADIYERCSTRGLWRESMGGCCHDEIVKFFPELEPFIQWHLCSSDGPMYYVSNTMYYARDRTHAGKEIGEAISFKTRLKFEGFPVTFKEQAAGFWNYLDGVGDFEAVEVEEVKYDGKDTYDFTPNYSLTGFVKENEVGKWYKAPFKSKREAVEFLDALRACGYESVKIANGWCEAVEPNIEAARSCAIWPNATLKQLQDKEALEARQPCLQNRFREAVEELGFTW
jgi:hypothetical protein